MEKIVNMMVKGDSLSYGDRQAPFEKAVYRGALIPVASAAAGGVLTLQNTTGYDMYVKDVVLDVTTKSAGIATVSAGSAATIASAAGSIATADVGTAPILVGNVGKIVRWKNGEYFTITASATVAGLVGTYVLECIAA